MRKLASQRPQPVITVQENISTFLSVNNVRGDSFSFFFFHDNSSHIFGDKTGCLAEDLPCLGQQNLIGVLCQNMIFF